MNTEEIELFTEFPEILKIYKASDDEYFLRSREVQAYANSIPNGTFIEIPRPNSLPPLPTDSIPVNEQWVKFPTLWQWKGDFSISGNVQLLPVPSLENRMWVYRIITTAGGSQAKELRWGSLESQKLIVGVGDFVMCTSEGWIKIENALRMKELEASVATMTAQAAALVANYPSMFANLFVTIYVHTNGNDNNTGLSAASPIKTLARASAIVSNKFDNATIVLNQDMVVGDTVGAYEVVGNEVFNIRNLNINLKKGITHKKYVGAGYEGIYYIANFLGNIRVYNDSGNTITLTVESRANVGADVNNYNYNYAAYKVGLNSIDGRLSFQTLSINLGKNTLLGSQYYGKYDPFLGDTCIDLIGCAVTIGTGANINAKMKEIIFVKTFIPTAGVWVKVLDGLDGILRQGGHIVSVLYNASSGGIHQRLYSGVMSFDNGIAYNGNEFISNIPLNNSGGYLIAGNSFELRTFTPLNSDKNGRVNLEMKTTETGTVPITLTFKFTCIN